MNLSQNFITFVTNTWGTQGTQWLNQLPEQVQSLCSKWKLTDIIPFDNLTYHYVARAYSTMYKKHLVLKIGIPNPELDNQIKALEYYAGNGCVQLLACDRMQGALLLDLIEPGTTLKSFFPSKDDQAVEQACALIKRLHSKPITSVTQFATMADWFSLFDTLELPQELQVPVAQARKLAYSLASTSQANYLLHGDLHHDNILFDASSSSWIAIDPKGVIGELAYEVGAFICNPGELASDPNLDAIIARRINQFSKILAIERQRLIQACYVRTILSVCWTVRDKGDWKDDMKIAQIIEGYL